MTGHIREFGAKLYHGSIKVERVRVYLLSRREFRDESGRGRERGFFFERIETVVIGGMRLGLA